jgi:hypothetical protein
MAMAMVLRASPTIGAEPVVDAQQGDSPDAGPQATVVAMCGRFDSSRLAWREIHDALARFVPVRTAALNLEASVDVRPTTAQLVAKIEDGLDARKEALGPGPRLLVGQAAQGQRQGGRGRL